MSPFMIFVVASKALARNRMRSILTMLGMVVGVSAVICTIAIGAGAAEKVRVAISSIGANMIWIEAGGVNLNGVRTGSYGTRSLTVGDAKAIQQEAEAQGAALLRERHRLRPGALDDFNIRHPTEIAQAVAASAQTMEVLLASVASVSLLVGGVGIMNIMLVSVTERTREIGLRLAVGARARDVLRQFLFEALLLSIVGGALGVALGLAGTHVIATQFNWPTHVSMDTMLLAFGVAGSIGLVFGYYPARRAARLDPIDALRFE